VKDNNNIENGKIRFIIFGGSPEQTKNTYDEVENKGFVSFMNGLTPKMGLVKSIIFRLHYSTKINKSINLPFKSCWYKHLSQKEFISKAEQQYFVFYDINRFAQNDNLHAYIRKICPKAKFIYILSGVYNVSYVKKRNYLDKLKKQFDLIITFEKEDAKKFGWKYCPYPYTKISVEPSNFPESDVFYVGYAKMEMYPDRFNTIISSFIKLRNAGLKCDFHIVGVEKDKQILPEEIKYNKPIIYKEIIQHIDKTKCILEVVQSDQTGTTLRVQESIFYNKKLLTNNINIISEPWYDKNNVFVFKDANEINIDWIKSKYEKCNENYAEIFSYKKHLEYILENTSVKELN